MSGRLVSRTSLITGTSGGLGRAIAIAYARQGANVVCADLAPAARVNLLGEDIRPTHEVIQQFGGNATFIKCDISEPADVQSVVKETIERYGRLDM